MAIIGKIWQKLWPQLLKKILKTHVVLDYCGKSDDFLNSGKTDGFFNSNFGQN